MAEVELKLACDIIQSSLGDLALSVASLLGKKGRLTLLQIAKDTSLKKKQVRDVLFVFLQQRIVRYGGGAVSVEIDADGYPVTNGPALYELDVAATLLRLRYPKCIKAARDLYGREAAYIVEAILMHGHLKQDRCIQEASLLIQSCESTPPVPDAIAAAFATLLRDKFITVVHVRDFYGEYDLRMLESKEQEMQENEHRASMGNAASQSMLSSKRKFPRKKKEDEGPVVVDDNIHIGSKRKLPDASSELHANKRSLIEGTVQASADHFRINFDRFNIYFRNECLAQIASEKINEGAGFVYRCFLRCCETTMHAPNIDTTSASISLFNICRAVASMHANPLAKQFCYLSGTTWTGNASKIQESVNQLASDEFRLMAPAASSGSESYNCNLRKLSTIMKQRIIESVVLDRHGPVSFRIFRLLIAKRGLEEKQISQFCLITIKETREMLYRLLQDGFIQTQEIPKTSDRAASRTNVVFVVDLSACARLVLRQCQKTIFNLRQRSVHEASIHDDLIKKSERRDVLANASLLTDREKDSLLKLTRTRNLLGSMELAVENTIMILQDF